MTARVWTAARRRWNAFWARYSGVLFRLAIVTLFVFPVLQESWDDIVELFDGNDSCTLQETELPAAYTFQNMYERAFRLVGRNRPSSDDVVAIGIPANLLPMQSDLCVGRLFLAKLVKSIAAHSPSAIVIDKTYSSAICRRETTVRHTGWEQTTDGLSEQAMSDLLVQEVTAAAKTIPMVFALSTEPTGNAREPCLCVTPSNLFDPSSLREYARRHYGERFQAEPFLKALNIQFGYSRLDADPAEIPIRWHDLAKPAASTDTVDGLAMAAARAARPSFPDWPLKAAGAGAPEHPFGFLGDMEHGASTEGERNAVCAMAVQGDVEKDMEGYVNCGTSGEGDPQEIAQKILKGVRCKIVVIGSEEDRDRVLVQEQSMFGYELQAKYIAALLGHAYLREWPLLVRLLVSLLVPFLVERAAYVWELTGRMHSSELRRLVWDKHPARERSGGLPVYGFIVLVVLALFAAALVALPLGWMPPFPVLAAVFSLLVLKTSDYLAERRKEHETHTKSLEEKSA